LTVEIYRERIPSTDPRLKRHVLHDSRAWNYRFDTTGLTIASVEHPRTLPILDQGQVGSCTADCGLGILGTEPHASLAMDLAVKQQFGSFDQQGAYRLYSAEETLDGDGPYPPRDEGSTGLTLAKVLRAHGLISGWQQTFTLDDALKALTQYPLAVGTVWYQSMFTPGVGGTLFVDAKSGVAGGHEYEVVGYDAASGRVKIANSWGAGWGLDGYAYMQAEDLGALLARRGDVTVFTPATDPAPVPTPPVPVDVDQAFAAVLRHDNWIGKPHVGDNRRVALAGRAWLTHHGL
jgi:papain like protease